MRQGSNICLADEWKFPSRNGRANSCCPGWSATHCCLPPFGAEGWMQPKMQGMRNVSRNHWTHLVGLPRISMEIVQVQADAILNILVGAVAERLGFKLPRNRCSFNSANKTFIRTIEIKKGRYGLCHQKNQACEVGPTPHTVAPVHSMGMCTTYTRFPSPSRGEMEFCAPQHPVDSVCSNAEADPLKEETQAPEPAGWKRPDLEKLRLVK